MESNNIFMAAVIYALLEKKGIGPASVNRLLQKWGTLSHNIRYDEKISKLADLANIDTEKFERSVYKWTNELEQLKRTRQISFIVITDSAYPSSLKELLGMSAPPALSYIGNANLLNSTAVGFCGSRNASTKGLKVASDTARELAKAGAIVVSGYARGVDMEAHLSSIKAGGRTILVLAEGIGHFRIKKLESRLGEPVDYSNILVLSEFSPFDKWSVSRAMQRNKTIIALTKALVVVEANPTGGTIEAGKTALKLGKPVFAAYYGPGKGSAGNQILLQMGARKFGRLHGTNTPNTSRILATLHYEEQKRMRLEQNKLFNH